MNHNSEGTNAGIRESLSAGCAVPFSLPSMRILHMINTLSPATGGPPEAVRQLIKGYISIGAEIEVVCLDDPNAEFLKDIQCPIHALNQSFLGRYSFSPRLWRWLRDNIIRFDGIVMNGIWSFPGVALRIAARRAGKPYGVFVHGALDPWFNGKYPLKHIKKLLYWPVQHAVLRDALAVFFTTKTERNLALTSFRPSNWNSMVVPYGIMGPGESWEGPKAQIEKFYQKFPELRRRRYLLFLARIHEKKGCDLLLKAFAKLADTAPEVDLVIAGPDQEGKQIKLKRLAGQLGIAGRIHWAGLIGGDIKWGALRACDAMILPSHQENLGVSVVEALSVGRPVLITYQVNIWQEIKDEGVGLADEDTLEGIARLLRCWFSLPEAERAKMAIRAEPCFALRFSMKQAAMAINQVFSPHNGEGANLASSLPMTLQAD
jgi:glycosyltransferase involved in cell wall biosynthesis